MTQTLEQLTQEWRNLSGETSVPRLDKTSAPKIMTQVPYEKRQFIYDLADYQLSEQFKVQGINQCSGDMTDEQIVQAYEIAASLHAEVEPERAFGRHNLNALFGKASVNNVFSGIIDAIATKINGSPQGYASRPLFAYKIGKFEATEEDLAKAKLREFSGVGEFEKEIGKLYQENKTFFDALVEAQERVFGIAVESALSYQNKRFTKEEAERFAYGVVPFADIQNWIKVARDPQKFDRVKVKTANPYQDEF